MYGIFTYMNGCFLMVNVAKYIIQGSHGIKKHILTKDVLNWITQGVFHIYIYISLRIQVCPKKGIIPTFLF